MLEVEEEAVPAVVMGVVEMVEVAAAEVEEMMMTTTMMKTPQLRPLRVHPDADIGDEPTGSSTTPRCNSNRPKSYKINAKRPRVDALQVSRPPTRSRQPTKRDDAPR